jgi:hypothetical protein
MSRRTARTAAPFEDGEYERSELAGELRLGKDAAKLVCNGIARKLVHAATERAEDDAVACALMPLS